ncbi:MAG TPA: DUF4998 domain-containing protein [Chitinophagaceae bacterium]
MRINQFNKFYLLLLMIAVAFVACSKMEDTYKEFVQNGEIIYTGRVDSVKSYPGKNRTALTMLLLSDPKISKVKVFWNNKTDSAVKDVVRTTGVDTVKFMLTNMTEGTYAFEIYTYDNQGHSSIKTDAIGIVYGQNYINSLFNRPLRSMTYAASKATLKWYGPSAQTIGQQINYTDSLNVAQSIFVPKADTMTVLSNFKKLGTFQYRTLYLPEVNAIDTFYSAYEVKQVL